MVITVYRIFLDMESQCGNFGSKSFINVNTDVYFYSLVKEEAKWSRGDSGRPAKAHKIEIECMAKATDLQLLMEKLKFCIVTDLSL